jgi:hypothetical protein
MRGLREAAFASLVAPALFFSPLRARAAEPDRYPAPDKRYDAAITKVKTGESKLAIGPPHGKARFSRSFASSDGEHGASVTKAAWTADSRFFVFILELSGGHQPWHHPIYFWDRQDGRLYSLDDRVGGVTRGFELASPDIVSGAVLGDPKDANFTDGVQFSVSLSSVAAHSKKPLKTRPS